MLSIRTLLIIEHDPGDARLLRDMLSENGEYIPRTMVAATLGEAEKHLAEHVIDIILLDLGLPDAQGLAAIRRTRAAAPGIPLVVLTDMDDEELAAQSLQEGAQDCLIKDRIESRGLLRALRYAAERKRLERMKDEFVSTVSHELRTPLTSISASLGLLVGKAAGILPEPAHRLLEIAHSNSQRLVRLINDILDIENLESGHVAFDLRSIDIQSLVEKTIEAMREFAESHDVRIRIADTSAVAEVRADADRLSQVITNLLSNAVKFSPPGKDVVVTIEKRDDVVRFSVRDHGPGIAANFKPHVFGRFAQADATIARRKGGTGLGLSIVKQIVERLDGAVGFYDAVGGGTIFYVDLRPWDALADRTGDEHGVPVLSEDEASLVRVVEAARDLMTFVPTQEAV
jgi:signal transduction histidine kinase